MAQTAECSPNTGGESEVAHQKGLGEAVLTPATQGSLPTVAYFLGAYITISQALKEPSEAPAGWLVPNKRLPRRYSGNSESC